MENISNSRNTSEYILCRLQKMNWVSGSKNLVFSTANKKANHNTISDQLLLAQSTSGSSYIFFPLCCLRLPSEHFLRGFPIQIVGACLFSPFMLRPQCHSVLDLSIVTTVSVQITTSITTLVSFMFVYVRCRCQLSDILELSKLCLAITDFWLACRTLYKCKRSYEVFRTETDPLNYTFIHVAKLVADLVSKLSGTQSGVAKIKHS